MKAGTLDRKYLFVLAGVAVVILGAGIMLKPRKPETVQPSPSEIANLQRSVRLRQMRETAGLLHERAVAAGRHVIWSQGSSGLLWQTGTLIVPPAAEPAVVVAGGAAGPPPYPLRKEDSSGFWLTLVGRTAENELLWWPALGAGSRPAYCQGAGYRELLVNVPLSAPMAGAAVFDLDGALAGVVVRCGQSFHIVVAESIAPLLASFDTPEAKLRSRFGLRVTPVEGGLMVSEIAKDGRAFLAGIEAGDTVVEIESAAALLSALEQDPTAIRVRRAGRTFSPQSAGVRFQRPADALEAVVPPGTNAYQAGLRTGDRILRGGGRSEPARRLVVWERGQTRFAAVIEYE